MRFVMEKQLAEKFNEFEITNADSTEPHENKQTKESHQCHAKSDIRRALSQYTAICALSFLVTSFGAIFGFSVIIIADQEELRKKDEAFISLSQLTWMSSMSSIAIVIGALFSGIISQRLGRRNSLILSTFPTMASWIIIHMCGDRQLWPIFIGLALLGCSDGIAESSLQVYIAEIGEPRHRGAMSTLIGVTLMFGVFLQVILGKYLDWRTLSLVNVSFPVLALISLSVVTESPYWLAGQGRHEESLQALAWFRGWSPVGQLPRDEFQEIISTASKRTDEPPSVKRYFERSIMAPFAVVSLLFAISIFNGNAAVLSWAISLFKEIHSPIEEHDATIILTAIQVIATVVITFLLPHIGKKKITLASVAATGLAFSIAALYILYGQESGQSNWVSTIGVLMAIGFSFLGVKHTPWIFASELFPSDVRSQVVGVLASSCQIYSSIASKSYVYVKQEITLPGTLLLFASVNFVGFAALCCVLPETQGKSLAEIERKFIERRKAKGRSAAEVSLRNP